MAAPERKARQSVKAGRGCAARAGRQGWGLECYAERWEPGVAGWTGVGLWGR